MVTTNIPVILEYILFIIEKDNYLKKVIKLRLKKIKNKV